MVIVCQFISIIHIWQIRDVNVRLLFVLVYLKSIFQHIHITTRYLTCIQHISIPIYPNYNFISDTTYSFSMILVTKFILIQTRAIELRTCNRDILDQLHARNRDTLDQLHALNRDRLDQLHPRNRDILDLGLAARNECNCTTCVPS